MSRILCISSADGHTGHLLTKLLLTDPQFNSKIKRLYCLAFNPDKCRDLAEMGAEIIVYQHDHKALAPTLRSTSADTIFLVPPSHSSKSKLTKELISAVKDAGIKNTVLLSSGGIDFAEHSHQPHLCQFAKIEAEMMMRLRYTEDTQALSSQCIIRPGYYAENLLLYEKDVKAHGGELRLPIGVQHSFAPVALDDVTKLAAHILLSEGPKGLDDRFRGQLITLTGPMMCDGYELAAAANQAGLNLRFVDADDQVTKVILDQDTDLDDSEKMYLLEYYSLVCEGKTNYLSTIAYTAITGEEPTKLSDFFRKYESVFKY